MNISSTIHTALENLKFFLVDRDKYLTSLKAFDLADWLPQKADCPPSAPQKLANNTGSYSHNNKLQLLKPEDFTVSATKDQTVTDHDSPMLSDEMNDVSDYMFGTYGRGALAHLYDSLDTHLDHEFNDYNAIKMDTSLQADRYEYRRINQELRMKRNDYLLEDENNNSRVMNGSVCRQKSLTGDVSMTCLSSDSGSVSEAENGCCKKLAVGTTMLIVVGSKISPSLFSVIPKKDVKQHNDFGPRISAWCYENQDLITLSDQDILEIKAGHVFAHFRADLRAWTRVRVKSIQLNESTPEDSKILAQFIDIGDVYEVEAKT